MILHLVQLSTSHRIVVKLEILLCLLYLMSTLDCKAGTKPDLE